jgi:hypothetical protein
MAELFEKTRRQPMINLLTALAITLAFLLSNYLALGYGLRIGKALQKDIPPAPLVEPVKRAVTVGVKLAKTVKGKKYLQKKAEKEEVGIFD